MNRFLWITGATIALTACGSGGGGSGLGSGDIFPEQYKNNNYSCTGTSTDKNSQGRQYTLVASISNQPLNLNGEYRQMQASLYDQSVNSTAGYSNSSYNYSAGYNQYGQTAQAGIGQSEPAEARYFQKDQNIILTPTNNNGTRSNWSGQFKIWASSSRGEFSGQLNGVNVRLQNMVCNQSGGTYGSAGQYGQTGTIPQYLTCQDSQYTASVSNGSMTLSRNGSIQETYSLITNGQGITGQSSQSYTVQSQRGSSGTGTATVSQSTLGSVANYATGGNLGGNYILRLNNVYYQNQPVNNSLTCR